MSERERWAYEELRPGDMIQEGDQWLNPDGRWQAIVLAPEASMEVGEVLRARRPHSITALEKYRGDLIDDIQHVIGERDEARAEVTQLRAERQEYTAKFEAEVTAAALVIDELSAAKEAIKSAQRARDELQLQVDELRADRTNEVTARQVQEVLRRWATELDWSADCFGSATREQVHGVQNTLIAVMQRIESMIDAEGSRANT